MTTASPLLRGCIVTQGGKKLTVSDLSNIEGAGWSGSLAWRGKCAHSRPMMLAPVLTCASPASTLFGVFVEDRDKRLIG